MRIKEQETHLILHEYDDDDDDDDDNDVAIFEKKVIKYKILVSICPTTFV